MTLDVKFEEQDQTFNTDFGEVQTVSDGGFERGYNEGYVQGEVEGYDKGKTDGLVDGYGKGKTDGLAEGYDKGKTDGLVEGEQVGFDNAVSKLTTLEVTENGEYTPSDDNIGFDKVTVNIGGEEKSSFAKYAEGTLTEITANDLKGATTIGAWAFFMNKFVTDIEIPDGVTTIGKNAFYYSVLATIKLPNTLKIIENDAFYECKLTSLKIPDSVTNAGNYLCENCQQLVEFDSGNGIKSIGSNALAYCTALTKIILGENIETIMEASFTGCSTLTSLTIPAKVNEIRYSALTIGSSTNKATITFLGTVPPTIKSNSLNSNLLNKIIVPKGSLDAYKSATNWSKFADYIEEASE